MDTENLLDLYNEMLEAQEADMEARGLMDAPDSFQIAGITEEELEDDLAKILPFQPSSGVGNVTVLDRDDEYTERDAFNDFIADQQEDWN